MINWINIIKGNYATYPDQGVDVLVSDGKNYDVAWFIMSGDYKWLKNNIKDDTAEEFNSFEISKWTYVNKELTRNDLISLIKGTSPPYSVFEHPIVKKNGSYVGGHVDKWTWNNQLGDNLTEGELWDLYKICRDS